MDGLVNAFDLTLRSHHKSVSDEVAKPSSSLNVNSRFMTLGMFIMTQKISIPLHR